MSFGNVDVSGARRVHARRLRLTACALLLLNVFSLAEEVQQQLPYIARVRWHREELELAVVARASEATLIVASRVGRNAAVAEAIIAAGGSILSRNDVVDYLRAEVPGEFLAKMLVSSDIESLSVLASTAPA